VFGKGSPTEPAFNGFVADTKVTARVVSVIPKPIQSLLNTNENIIQQKVD
jgi:hypothetical protein